MIKAPPTPFQGAFAVSVLVATPGARTRSRVVLVSLVHLDAQPAEAMSLVIDEESTAKLWMAGCAALGQQSAVVNLFAAQHPDLAANKHVIAQECVRFMVIKVTQQDIFSPTRLSPPDKVDKFWHTHVLCTAEYRHFCTALTKFIEHDALAALGSEQEQYYRYKETWRAYPKVFIGVTAPRSVWADPAADAREHVLKIKSDGDFSKVLKVKLHHMNP